MKLTGFLFKLTVACVLFVVPANFLAQDVQERSIKSKDFAVKRPPATRPAARTRPQFSYKSVRVEKNVIRPKAGSKPPVPTPVVPNGNFTDLGVTMWKLRPALSGEAGYMFPVVAEKELHWLAERVGTDVKFKPRDKVRFAVESTVAGHLYVFDRETYSDGSMGEPFLIFPESLDEDNWVGPGMIADIPDQTSEQPYFDMNPKKANYNGELLTIILSSRPITNFVVDDEGKLRNADDLVNLEFGSEAEIFSRSDAADKIYSKTESKSACGVKTRQLERVKSAGKPCGNNSTRLTPDEPLPQSIYRIKAVPGQPAVAFVKLSVP